MRSRGVDAVRDALLSEIEGERQAFDTTILEGLDDAQAEDLLLHTLRSIGVNLQFGTRPPEEIVRRLVRTMRTNDQRATIERAIDVLSALSAIRGTPSDALARLRDLIARYTLPDPGLADLQALIDLLPLHGLDVERITLDFGLGRGLHYYTGMMFEIDNPTGLQLCGGGRYDELVTALGGRQSTPAVGFAYGLERVVLAAPELPQAQARSVIVIPQDADAYADAVQIAHRLREAGVVAQCEMRERTMAQHLKDAQRRGLVALIVQPHDAQTGTAQWRHDGESLTLSLSEIIARCEVSP
jgi:histidyl-tRNA synthetase